MFYMGIPLLFLSHLGHLFSEDGIMYIIAGMLSVVGRVTQQGAFRAQLISGQWQRLEAWHVSAWSQGSGQDHVCRQQGGGGGQSVIGKLTF